MSDRRDLGPTLNSLCRKAERRKGGMGRYSIELIIELMWETACEDDFQQAPSEYFEQAQYKLGCLLREMVETDMMLKALRQNVVPFRQRKPAKGGVPKTNQG
jgi:hypothetical protein